MLNGLYVAASGLMMQNRRVENITNNLANINTTGYKKDIPTFTQYIPAEDEFPQTLIRQSEYNKSMNATVKESEQKTDFTVGYLQETGNKLDFALKDPNMFFTVDTPYGIRFTRAGDFTININGELVTAEGYQVLSNTDDAAQPIIMPDNFEISEEGAITVDGEVVNQLGIAYFENTDNLQKVGRNLFAAVGVIPEDAENPQVINGFLEGSNVNSILEMVRMIDAMRSFETYQKAIQTMDSINGTVISTVGKMS
jgi:flagellar basal-body rod protein FlgG